MKIVLDGYGGDKSPSEVVAGAVLAVQKFNDVEIILTGKEDELKNLLAENKYTGDRITVLNATEVITNNDAPTVAIRQKKDSSLVVGIDYINNNENEDIAGLVSAGSTGAVLTGALLKLGRLDGIKRPALAPLLPNLNGGKTMLIDCGANMDCKPEFLCQFAIMGTIYMKKMFNIQKPRVALLNVGTEDKKGNEQAHAAFELLKELKEINFVGNMEARDLLSGDYDVVVSDGFAGNVALKASEGTGLFFLKSLKKSIKSGGLRAKLGYLLLKKSFKEVKDSVDFNKIGGSPFLGCKKVVIKSHGSSDRIAILGSITLCRNVYLSNFVNELQGELAKLNLE